MPVESASPPCRTCVHFRNDPAFLEAAIPGLTSLSSGYASVRAADGLCLLHDRCIGAEAHCPHHRFHGR